MYMPISNFPVRVPIRMRDCSVNACAKSDLVAGGTLRFCSNREANGDENGQQRTLEASSLDLTISLAVVSTFDQVSGLAMFCA